MLFRIAFLIGFVLLGSVSSANFAIFQVSVPSSQGGGVNLALANIFSPPYGTAYSQRVLARPAASTADYYHTDGIIWAQPYDLNAMGSWGQAIATTKGYRYVWLISPDHPGACCSFPGEGGWGNDASYVYVGYSNDPAIMPDPGTMTPIIPPGAFDATIPGLGGNGKAYSFMIPWLVYNPDDVSNRAYLYTECIDNSGDANNTAIQMCLWKRDDFDGQFTAVGVSHQATCSSGCGFTSFQTVYRTGVNTWVSYGGNDTVAGTGRWTSTNGSTFTRAATINTNETCPGGGTCSYSQIGTQKFSVSGQSYVIQREDARSGDGGMYVTMAPIDANGNIISSPAVTRLSSKYDGIYPGPTYLQNTSAYIEDGVAYAYALHGFFSDVGLVPGALYTGGGGLDQQYLDLYVYVVDAIAAAERAPAGVSISVAGGIVALSWYDMATMPGHTYRVYRCTAGEVACSSTTLVGDVTGGSATDSPSVSSSCTLTYYKVVTLTSGVEKGSRIVGSFVSSSSAFVNKHMTRVCNAGADYTTIDRTWLDSVDSFLNSNGLQTNLMFWTNSSFGVIKSGSTISRIMDIGTTRLPRGGDYTPRTPANTTYSVTGCNSSVPGWINVDGTSEGYYGGGAGNRLNQIRLKTGYSFVAVYSTNNNSSNTTPLSIGINDAGVSLKHIFGGTQQAQWNVAQFVSPSAWILTDNKNLTGATTHIIGGTFNGVTATVYVEGSAGSGVTPAVDNSPLLGQVSAPSNVWILNSGSSYLDVSTGGSITKNYNYTRNEAQYNGCDLIVFDAALTSTQMSALTTLLRTRIGP